MRISFVLDDAPVEAEVSERDMLVHTLRELGHTSVRVTCGIGVCGACTVLLDDEPVSACLMLAAQVEGRRVTTVEGLLESDVVLRAFSDMHAFQCGWCTPGMVLTVKATLADDDAEVTRAQLARALGGNLCRCGCYERILDAAELAASRMRSQAKGALC